LHTFLFEREESEWRGDLLGACSALPGRSKKCGKKEGKKRRRSLFNQGGRKEGGGRKKATRSTFPCDGRKNFKRLPPTPGDEKKREKREKKTVRLPIPPTRRKKRKS